MSAEEFEEKNCDNYDSYSSMMKAFAEFHVEQALKAVTKIDFDNVTYQYPDANDAEEARELAILNCYSKDLI